MGSRLQPPIWFLTHPPEANLFGCPITASYGVAPPVLPVLPAVPEPGPFESVSLLPLFLDFLDFFDLPDDVSELVEVDVWELFVPLVSAGLLVLLLLCVLVPLCLLLSVSLVPVVLELPFEL